MGKANDSSHLQQQLLCFHRMAPDKLQWTGCLFPSSRTHTPPRCYGALHTHKCVSSYLSTDWTQGNYFWDTNDQSPSLFLHRHSCSRQAAAGMLHKGPSSPHGGQWAGAAALQRAQPVQKFLTPHTPALAQTPAELCLISSPTGRQFCPFSFI